MSLAIVSKYGLLVGVESMVDGHPMARALANDSNGTELHGGKV